MLDGEYEFYTFEQRLISRSATPDGPLSIVYGTQWQSHIWSDCGVPLELEEENTLYAVLSETGRHGFWRLKDAEKVLKRMRKANKNGMYDFLNAITGQTMQQRRMKFRVVKVRISQITEVLDNSLSDAEGAVW